MPLLMALLLFCDFLEHRLLTSNLVLFRRMLSDFFAGNERTLQDFIRLGASIVTIMPMGRTQQIHQQEAARLLTQKQQMSGDSKQHSHLCVFRYLSARIATKNIFLLHGMFEEFSAGGDSLISEFVRRGTEVISVIPVDIPPQPGSSLLKLPEEQSFSRGRKQVEQEDSEEDEDEIVTLDELNLVTAMPPTSTDRCVCIIEVLEQIEQQEPWKRVFNPDTLPVPFSGAKRHKLFAALNDFWTENGRAVWERHFWGPLVKLPNQHRRYLRKARQAKARGAFNVVMTLVYKELGASFFVQMDQRAKPHKGWWYSAPVQTLDSIAQHFGMAACVDYMETQAFKRFPLVPGGNSRLPKRDAHKSKSMWATSSDMAPILHDICAAKASDVAGEIK